VDEGKPVAHGGEAVTWMEWAAAPQRLDDGTQVGWCRLTVSKPVLKAPTVSALEAPI
jgi:hypothetical protein